MCHGSVRLSLLFAIVVDGAIEKARRGVINEVLNADELILMRETIKDLKERFCNWKEALKSKHLKVNMGKTKVMASESERELFKSL